MTIIKNQYKQVDEYLNHKSKIELSLETEVFLSFKHRTPNRYKLLDKLIRASITPEEELTDKTVYLGEKAKKLLRAILKKLFSNRYVLINHKYITQATRCKSDQNTIILKELERILKIQFYRIYTNNKGTKFSRHYYIELHPAVVDELKDTGHDNSEFYPEKNRPTYTNRNIFNEDKDIDLESNFLQNSEEIKIEENRKPQVAVFPPESINSVKLKKRLPNERKKPTNTEKKAKVYYFNQYKEPQTLKYHYPLTKKDCNKLQNLSGRDFNLNAMNEILLDMSKRVDNRFCSKAQFMVYFAKCLRFEMRDAVKINNVNFHIKANHMQEKQAEIDQMKQVERYLAEIEQKAITNVCPENQLRARLANTLEAKSSYELLSTIKDFKVVGNTMRIYLRSTVDLNKHKKEVVLSQVRSIYSNSELDIESVEYVVKNVHNFTNKHTNMQKKSAVDLQHQGAWGDACRQLIKTYGIHIYNNWFSKLTPVINEDAKTIALKAPNSFVKQWVETNYRDTIRKAIENQGREFKGIIQQSTNQKVL
jgi:hypothetical protein